MRDFYTSTPVTRSLLTLFIVSVLAILPQLSQAQFEQPGYKPNLAGTNGAVYATFVDGNILYIGGNFTQVGSDSRAYIAAIDLTTGQPTSWNPNADAPVNDIKVSGTTVYVGGDFNNIGGQNRNYIAALSTTTGLASSWNPSADNSVLSLNINGSIIYAGGSFSNIGGQARNRLAALDITTGAATTWNPNPDANITYLTSTASTVYAAGAYSNIGGQSRSNLAAIDATTGLATSWSPNPDGEVKKMIISGNTAYICGLFSSTGGQSTQGLASVNLSTGAAFNIGNISSTMSTYSMELYNGFLYTVGLYPTISETFFNKLDTSTRAYQGWTVPYEGVISNLIYSNGSLIAGGIISTVNSQPVSNLVAFSTAPTCPAFFNPPVNTFSFMRCSNDSANVDFTLDLGNSGAQQYVWKTGNTEITTTTPTLRTNIDGYYRVKLGFWYAGTTLCYSDYSTDSFNVFQTVIQKPTLNFYDTVTFIPRPASDTILCSGERLTLYILGSIEPDETVFWQDNSQNILLVVTAPGVYKVRKQNYTNSCYSEWSDSITVQFRTPPLTPQVTFVNDDSACFGEAIKAYVAGNPGLTRIWTEPNLSFSYTGDTLTATQSGNYQVRLADGGCNSDPSASVMLTILPQLTTSISSGLSFAFCSGDSATVDLSSEISGFDEYIWETGGQTTTTTYGPILRTNTPGNYRVKVGRRYSEGLICYSDYSFESFTVTQNSIDKPSVLWQDAQFNTFPARDTTLCQGEGLVLMSIAPDASYQWSTGETNSSITVTQPGNYKVKVISSLNGCISEWSDSITVQFNSLPTPPTVVVNGSSSICEGDSVQLQAVGAIGAVLWSNGATGTSTFVKQANNYTAKQVVNNCESGFSTPVVISTTPRPTTPTISVLNGHRPSICRILDSVFIQADVVADFYQWSNGRVTTSPIIGVGSAANISVIAINGSCQSAPSNQIVITQGISVNVQKFETLCDGQTYVFKNRTYTASGIYFDTTVMASGCDSIVELNLTFVPLAFPPTLSQTGVVDLCSGQSVKITGSGTQILWERNGQIITPFIDSLEIKLPGIYRAITYLNNCPVRSTDSVIATFTPSAAPINIVANRTELCSADSAGSFAILKVNGLAPGTAITWLRDDVPFLLSSTADSIRIESPGLYKVFTSIGGSCGSVDSVQITEAGATPQPELVLNNGNGCRGDSITLGTQMPYDFYFWSNGATSPSIKVPAVGNYYVKVQNGNSCPAYSAPFGFASVQTPSICLVTVNDTANINTVVWVKAADEAVIDSVIILREDWQANRFNPVGKVAYNEAPFFSDRDRTLNTQAKGYRYRVVFVDTCGRRSRPSNPFRTIFLRTYLQFNGGINLRWIGYGGENVPAYYIARQNQPGQVFEIIDSTLSTVNQYTDLSASISPETKYQIWYEREGECSTDKAGVKTSRSNVNSVRPKPPIKSSARFAPAICEGRPYNFNGTILTSSDSVTLVLKDRNNLDSIAVVYVEFNKPDTTEITATTCKDVPYFFIRRNVSGAGSYRDTLRNRLGCDSLMILTLSEYKSDTTRLTQTICEGDSILFGGNFIKTAGAYSTFVQDKNDCDSIIILNLDINPRPAVPFLNGLNDSIVVSNPEAGVTYQWAYNGNPIALIGSKIRSQGNGTYGVLATNNNGCLSFSTLYQWNGISLRASNMVKVNLYPNPASETVTIVTDEPILSLELTNTLGQKVEALLYENRINVQDLPKGVYRVLIQTTKGFANKTLVKQ